MSAGFGSLARSELTKLLSVRRWLVALGAMAVLTVGFGALSASGSSTDANQHPDFVVGPQGLAVHDDGYMVHGPVTGDATVTTQVTSQKSPNPDAEAGLMFKQGTKLGSPYVSIAVTPADGVRFDADYGAHVATAAGAAPRWLRLSRHGSEIRGYTSADGKTWELVGTAELPSAGRTLEAGLFVTSPHKVKITRTSGGTAIISQPTVGRATFADLDLTPAGAGSVAGWHGKQFPPGSSYFPRGGPGKVPGPKAVGGPLTRGPITRPPGSGTVSGGVWTLTGSGEIARAEMPDDSVQTGLFGTLFGLMALAAVAVLFATSEYKRHLVWTTFAATPRRRAVLAAKALVLAATTFALGLVVSVVAYFVTRPIVRSSGFTLPAFQPTSIGQPAVLRAIVGNAVMLTAFALFGLGLGIILRRSSGAIAAVFALGVVPMFAAAVIPPVSKWLMWLTPAGGFAIERAKPPSAELAEPWSQINPWLGLGITCAYAVVALGAAAWLIERRDA